MKIELTGISNLKPMMADLSALQAELSKTAAVSEAVWKASSGKGYISPQAFRATKAAGDAAHAAFADALASSKSWRVEQVRVNSATDDFIGRLKKQKISLAELRKNQALVNAAYREQIKLMSSAAAISQTTKATGRDVVSLAIPTRADVKQVENFGNRLKWLSAQWVSAGTIIQNSGKNIQWAGRQLTVGLSVPIAAFGAASGKLAYDLDHGLVQVTKVYNTTANQFSSNLNEQKKATLELDQVRKGSTQLAINMAKQYGTSLKDTMDVESQLAATGLKGQELYKSTASALRAAMLGELDYQDTVKTTIALQSILGQNAKQTADSWNYMNKIENQTSLTMDDLAKAIPIALQPVHALGGSLQDLGTMMAAMKEQGVPAAQAANSLKSSLTRLYRPSKQVQQEFKELTGKSITKLVSQSHGLIDVFEKLNDVTANLSKEDRVKAFAGLFGTYQVSRLMALTHGMSRLEKGVGQVSEAYKIGKESADAWGKTSQAEVNQITQSVSGKFKRAVATLQVSLATMGKPFLEFATMTVKGINKIIDGFNSLPDAIKKFVSAGLLFAAIVGPITMLAGLLKNFGGTMFIAGAKALGAEKVIKAFGGTMELLTKEEVAQNKVADIMIEGFKATSTEALNARSAIIELTQAMEHSQKLERSMLEEFKINDLLMSPRYQAMKADAGSKLRMARSEVYSMSAAAKSAAKPKVRMQYVGDKLVTAENVAATKAQAAAEAAAAASAEREAAAKERSTKAMQASKLAGGIMAASLAASLLTSNKLVDSAMKWSMVAAGVIPILAMVSNAMKKIIEMQTAANAAGFLGSLGGGIKGKIAGSAIGRFAKASSAARAGGAGIRTALKAGIMGTTVAEGGATIAGMGALTAATGGLALAAAGVGAAFYLWHRHLEKVKADMKELSDEQKAMNNAGNDLLKILGKQEYHYKNIAAITAGAATSGQQDQMDKMLDYYGQSGKGHKLVQAYNQASPEQRSLTLMQQFRAIMGSTNGNVKLAQRAMTAFLTSTGKGLIEANAEASDLVNNFKSMGKGFDAEMIAKSIHQALSGAGAQVADLGRNIGKTFADSLARSGPAGRKKLIESLSSSYTSGLQGLIGKNLSNLVSKQGITNTQLLGLSQLRNFTGTGRIGRANNLAKEIGISRAEVERLSAALAKMPEEKVDKFLSLWQNVAKQIGLSKFGIKTMGQMDTSNYLKVLSATNPKELNKATLGLMSNMAKLKKQQSKATPYGALKNTLTGAVNEVTAVAAGYGKTSKSAKAASQAIAMFGKKQALSILNSIRAARGLKETTNIFDWLGPVSEKAASGVEKAAHSMRDASAAAKAWKSAMSGGWIKNTAQEVMTSVTSDMGQMVQDNFTAAQQRAESANQAYWAGRSNALQRRQSAASDAMSRRQDAAQQHMQDRQAKREDAINKFYDNRIAKIQKEIDAEQKAEKVREAIFAAEQKRIERLKDLQNNQIDFNLAVQKGQFDEAAKIQNDMQATLESNAMQDASDKGQAGSEARVNRKQKQIDRLNKEKDAAIKRYQKLEQEQQRHLQRAQDNEQRALQKRQAAQSAALEKEQKASEAATTAMWQDRQKKLQLALDDLNSYIPTSEADLQRHIQNVAKKYDVFGNNLQLSTAALHHKISTDYDQKMQLAANKLRSDINWAAIGNDIVKKMIFGPLGFSNWKQFKSFMINGTMPKGNSNSKGKSSGHPSQRGNLPPRAKHDNTPGWATVHHAGGEIGIAPSNRRSTPLKAPMKNGEETVLAEKGEFMVNKKAAKAHKPLLEAINRGKNATDTAKYATGGYGGPLAMMGAMFAPLMKGVQKGVERAYTSKLAEIASSAISGVMGAFGAPKAGTFGGVNLDPSQIKNAVTIANVGKSMGMSARDIEIALMTSMQESTLRNLHYGDRDSQGLFQQRPSMGWGTVAQVTNPKYASHKFFSALKGVAGRGNMPMTLAAQAVQRSAYPYAYAKWQAMAIALFKALHKGGGAGAGFIPGKGGTHRPVRGGTITQGIHDQYTGFPAIDIGVPVGTPVYAVANGRIGISKDYRGSDGRVSNGGYYSYGRYITLNLDGGGAVNYAHLSQRYARAGQKVQGGSVIGRSGNTGHSFGPHLHFGAHPMSPYKFMKRGGFTLTDGMANLHKGETVLTAPLSKKLNIGIDNLADGPMNTYNIDMKFYGVTDSDEIAQHVIKTIKREERRKPGKRNNKQ